MLLYKYFAVKYKVCHQTATGPLFLSLSSSCQVAIVAANGEITKVMVSEKEETIWRTSCSLAWPDHSSIAQGVIAFSIITSCKEKRPGWSHIVSLFFPACGPSGPQEKKVGYTTLRSGHTRLEESQLKEVNTQSIHTVKSELAKYAAQHGIWWL